jgi:hypothetical protein
MIVGWEDGYAAFQLPLRAGSDVVVIPQEQITQRVSSAVGEPALGQVMRPIMQHVAALAERAEIGEPVVRGIAIKVGGSEHDASGAQPRRLNQVGPACEAASLVAPVSGRLVEPSSVG